MIFLVTNFRKKKPNSAQIMKMEYSFENSLVGTYSPNFLFLFFCFWNFFHTSTFYPTPPLAPNCPLPTYSSIYLKLKVDFSPFTYSPINLKCVIFISTHLPTYQQVPNPTYMATPTCMVATPINPQWSTTIRKEWNEDIAWSLLLFIQTFINKGMIKVFDTPYIRVLQVLLKKCFLWGFCKPSG